MREPLERVMGSCLVGRWVVTSKVPVMLHCGRNVKEMDTFVIPFCSIVVKKDYSCTNGCHWCTVVIKDSMNLVVGRNQRVDPGWSDKVDNDVNLGYN